MPWGTGRDILSAIPVSGIIGQAGPAANIAAASAYRATGFQHVGKFMMMPYDIPQVTDV
jgi:hypothetical protein